MATIGGVTVGSAGTGIFAGFSLLTGDDFDALPTRWNGGVAPTGKYASSSAHSGARHLTDRTYRQIALDPTWRGANSTSLTGLGVDPVSVASSVATLTAAPLSGSLAPYLPTDYTPSLSSACLDTWPSVLVSAAGDFIIDATISFSSGVARGSWPAFWTSTLVNWPNEGEIDVFESKRDSSGNIKTLITLHASASDTTPGTGDSNTSILTNRPIPANQMVRYVCRKLGGTLTFYDDSVTPGTLAQIASYSGALVARLRGAHRIRFDFNVAESWDGSTFVLGDWPQSMSIADWKLWVPTSRYADFIAHTVLPAVNVAPGGAWTSTFPDAVTLYGSTPDIETIVPAFDNPDCPGQVGKGYVDNYLYTPGGMTVDRALRTISGTVGTDKGGATGMLFAGSFTAGGQVRAALKMFNVAPAVQGTLFSSGFPVVLNKTTTINVAQADFHSGNLGPHTYTAASDKTWAVVTVASDGRSFSVAATPTTIDSATITVNATNSIGQVTTVSRSVAATTAFADSFNYPDGGLQSVSNGNWTRVGTVDAVQVKSGALITTTGDSVGSLYQSPSLGSVGFATYAQASHLSYSGFLCVMATDANNFVGVRANSSTTKPEVFSKSGGTLSAVATFNETITATDVVRLTYNFATQSIRVTKNDVALTLATGSLTIAAPPAVSYRQGVVGRINTTIGLLDDYQAGLLQNSAATVALQLGTVTMTATAAVSSRLSVALVPGSFVLAIAAVDPDSSAFVLTPGRIGVDIEARSVAATAAALALNPISFQAVVADPDSSSFGLVLDSFAADIEAASEAAAISELFLGSVSLEITAFVAAPEDVTGSFAFALEPFVIDVETEVSDSIHSVDIALLLGSFGIDIEAEVTGYAPRRTLSEIIPTLLNGLVDKRVWQLATPDNLPRDSNGHILPFILWHRVGGRDEEFIDQTMPTHRHARIQVQSCARGGIAADTLHEAVCQALLGSAYTVGVLGSPVGTYDADRKLHAPWQQFSIWFQP